MKHCEYHIILITAVIYGFRNKLECLSLNTRLGWKGLPGTKLQLITETANYGRNEFYDTGPKKSIGVPKFKINLSKFPLLFVKDNSTFLSNFYFSFKWTKIFQHFSN